jgi:hypothetical protein
MFLPMDVTTARLTRDRESIFSNPVIFNGLLSMNLNFSRTFAAVLIDANDDFFSGHGGHMENFLSN